MDEESKAKEAMLALIKPSTRRVILEMLDEGKLAEVDSMIKTMDVDVQDAHFLWKKAGAQKTTVVDPLLKKILAEVKPSLHEQVTNCFNSGDVAGLELLVDELFEDDLHTQDEIFFWKEEKLSATFARTALERQSYGTGPSLDETSKCGGWATVPTEHTGLLIGSKGTTVKGIEYKYACSFIVQPGDATRPSRYQVQARTEQIILQVHKHVLQILASSVGLVARPIPYCLYEHLTAMTDESLVDVQREYRVFIQVSEMNVKGWNTLDIRNCVEKLCNDTDNPVTDAILNSICLSRANNLKQKKRRAKSVAPKEKPVCPPPTISSVEHAAELLANMHTYPDNMNILLLGMTGVGKSTFINAFVNYLKHGTLAKAAAAGPSVVIKSSFLFTRRDCPDVQVVSEPNITADKTDSSNEVLVGCKSATQDPKAYVFNYYWGGRNKSIRLIDTPGIMDTEGIAQDAINFDKILKHITRYEEINAICILLTSNESRLTMPFKYCIDELLVHLHHDASKNILFCFTKIGNTMSGLGDTLSTMREYLEDFEKKRGIKIPMTMSKMYCFDSESFRYLATLKSNCSYTDQETNSFKEVWERSSTETFRMLDHIATLPVHKVQETLSLNNARNVIVRLSAPLAEITRQLVVNKKAMEEKTKELETCIQMKINLTGRLYISKSVPVAREIDYPMTVCVNENCMDIVVDENENSTRVFKQECHPHCYLVGVEVGSYPNPILQNCAAMQGQYCRVCKCTWQTHNHIRYKIDIVKKQIENQCVRASIDRNDQAEQTARILIDVLKRETSQAEETVETIRKYASSFAQFLKKHSILQYSDSYLDYIGTLIKEERRKGAASTCLVELEQTKESYLQRVQFLEGIEKWGDSQVLTAAQVDKKVAELHAIEDCREFLADVKKLELLSVQRDKNWSDQTVSMKKSWLTQTLAKLERN